MCIFCLNEDISNKLIGALQTYGLQALSVFNRSFQTNLTCQAHVCTVVMLIKKPQLLQLFTVEVFCTNPSTGYKPPEQQSSQHLSKTLQPTHWVLQATHVLYSLIYLSISIAFFSPSSYGFPFSLTTELTMRNTVLYVSLAVRLALAFSVWRALGSLYAFSEVRVHFLSPW